MKKSLTIFLIIYLTAGNVFVQNTGQATIKAATATGSNNALTSLKHADL